MKSKTFDWMVLTLHRSLTRTLSNDEFERFSIYYEYLDLNQVFKLININEKISKNSHSLKSIKKRVGEWVPPKIKRRTPSVPQRKRGYRDKGTMVDESSRTLRRIAGEACIHINAFDEYFPRISNYLRNYKSKYLSERGDFVLINELVDILEEFRELYPEDYNFLLKEYEELTEIEKDVLSGRKML